MGRMKFFKNTNASSNVLNEFVYSYNTANQITQITEPTVKTRTFGYDNADRLTTSTSTLPNQNESYTFDDVGNRTSSHLSSVYGYQQGSFNRLASTQQASYSFDNNGNLTSKSEGTAKWYYSYDRENRLMNAAKFGGLMPRASENINYQYDAFGRRVVRQDKKTGRTEFTHDGMDVIQDRFEKNDGSISTTNYVNGLGIDDKLKLTNGSTSRYFLTDHLGSTVGMADTNGNITESASYDSFGRTISSNLTTRYQYTGRETDEKTGLMYYRARQYDPQIGRFTSEDPIGFAGGDVNLYGYARNKPLRFIDSLGTTEEDMIWRLERYNSSPERIAEDQQSSVASEQAKVLRHLRIEKMCKCNQDADNATKIAIFISGSPDQPFIDPSKPSAPKLHAGGANINPNGQSFTEIRDKVESMGFSWFPNFQSDHIGGDDYRVKIPNAEWYHITIGRPGNGIFWDPVNEPPPWITIHCHGSDPLGRDHINDHLWQNDLSDLIPSFWPWD